ncbi:hypothetical protein Bca4012_017219 [Brassica carinata]|uniref:RING-type domain-containing protein n=1 Tax=Brassica carinata TaxID=52824 RepID=A0A8X7WP82_BRACI|nr:hypothetical protein Bca52824_004321 [Brassica carinata]
MDPGYLHERAIEIYGTKIDPNRPNPLGCYIGVDARLFRRLIYREPNHPELLVEQVVYGRRRREILNRHLPHRAKHGPAELGEEIILNAPHLGHPENVLLSGPSVTFLVNDVNWNNVAQTLSTYAEDSDAFPSNGRRTLYELRADVACGAVKVMTPELGWIKSHFQVPVGNVHDTSCLCCRGSYNFQDPNHIHQVIELPCRHVFHKTCIYQWMWTNQSINNRDNNNGYCYCPTCRTFIS